MKKLLVIIAFAWGVSSCQNVEDKSKVLDKPNILLLLADDMGYGELGSYGQKVIKTPFLDRLASESVRFTDFYSGTSVCSPSRASLMTGKHVGHLSIRGNQGWVTPEKWGRIALDKSEITIAEMLRDAGYQTAMIGKWHLGIPEDTSTWAKGRGFEYAVQEQWGLSTEGQNLDERMHWINNRKDSLFYDYNEWDCLDEFRTNFALEYLDKKSEDKPFFLYMSYRIPHAHEFFLKKNDLYAEHKQEWPEIERRHAARITMLDMQIKRLFDKLEAMGELENTLIVFTSDNGPHNENHHDRFFFESSGGLKGYKRDVYEGGVRVPAMAYWKGKINSSETNHMAAFWDIMPTLAEVAGIPAPDQTDGISFLPTLLGKEQQKHKFLYWEIHEGNNVKGFHQAIRMDNWKAVRYGDNYRTELYDLNEDLFEKNDISESHTDIVQQMDSLFKVESVKNDQFPFSGGVFKEDR